MRDGGKGLDGCNKCVKLVFFPDLQMNMRNSRKKRRVFCLPVCKTRSRIHLAIPKTLGILHMSSHDRPR